MSESYGKKIESAEVMLAGITSHKEELAVRGINDQYIEKFGSLHETCIDTNNKQEKAKAAMVDLTQTLNELMENLEKEMQFCKRVVMTDIPKSQWKEFGMQYRPKKKKPGEKKAEENPEE